MNGKWQAQAAGVVIRYIVSDIIALPWPIAT
ncbi:hypothetical protein HNR31_000948 [Anoxybacillus caldiproteolyticus]|uniref:Uncharacterized protein n=1 Tax=Thermaerobacillus caldiproteolyticus TaxID=247480 RepID=A0A7W0BXM9_9BACL|nr:hypothetical protein [Anoxybacillus caldiproteolyticus]